MICELTAGLGSTAKIGWDPKPGLRSTPTSPPSTGDHTLLLFLRASHHVSAGIEMASFEERNVPTIPDVMDDLISRMFPASQR